MGFLLPPPPPLSQEEFERRNLPGATLQDIDPEFCQWFEETSLLYPFRQIWRWILGWIRE